MPVITQSSFRPPLLLSNGHLQTLYPTLFRRVHAPHYQRERIETPDGDFLDLDWAWAGRSRLAILLHGLEGNTRRQYMTGMVQALNQAGWDCLAVNLRGCGGEPNRLTRFYCAGSTDDLETVIRHTRHWCRYRTLALVGFSLGGNILLLHLGQRGARMDSRVRCAVAFSVPCDLASSARQLARISRVHYMRYFLSLMRKKIEAKSSLMPGRPLLGLDEYSRLKSFAQFDQRYTAPMNGFSGTVDYWRRCSSKPWLPRIRIPTLLVNACNDPFLAPECYPVREATRSRFLFMETPGSGGHTGFVQWDGTQPWWAEKRTVQFLETHAETNVYRVSKD